MHSYRHRDHHRRPESARGRAPPVPRTSRYDGISSGLSHGCPDVPRPRDRAGRTPEILAYSTKVQRSFPSYKSLEQSALPSSARRYHNRRAGKVFAGTDPASLQDEGLRPIAGPKPRVKKSSHLCALSLKLMGRAWPIACGCLHLFVRGRVGDRLHRRNIVTGHRLPTILQIKGE